METLWTRHPTLVCPPEAAEQVQGPFDPRTQSMRVCDVSHPVSLFYSELPFPVDRESGSLWVRQSDSPCGGESPSQTEEPWWMVWDGFWGESAARAPQQG